MVLDTNVVLDWLLFRNAAMDALAAAIGCGGVCWVASPRIQAELATTLNKTTLARWKPDSEHILTRVAGLVKVCAEPQMPPGLAVHCTDPDDQVFIDLALVERASWLVTRDRALLKLARRVAAHGLTIGPPERWTGA